MFLATYKTTIKIILRSPLFWFMSIFVFMIVFRQPFSLGSQYSYTLNELLQENDPRIIIDYYYIIKKSANASTTFMSYASPIFTVMSVVLILNRDYSDNFYEIEKAADIKPSVYLFGRISALITVNFLFILICALINFYLFFIIHADDGVEWGRIESMDMGLFLSESIPRILRNVVYIAWPSTLVYITLTYFIGSIFRNEIPAAIISFTYVILSYSFNLLTIGYSDEIIVEFYNQYLKPIPNKLSNYFYYFDTTKHADLLNLHK